MVFGAVAVKTAPLWVPVLLATVVFALWEVKNAR
jgi:hypothetical protein